MRVLVTWGSKMGGTEGIAHMLAEALESEGLEVDVWPPEQVERPDEYDAVIVGGGLYANRWQRDARRFVLRHVDQLRRTPVWFFSSGPLDDSADKTPIPPTREVAVLMERVGALGHATFGGRLRADAQGFPAASMAKTRSGDWRRPERIEAWARELARAMPTALPGIAHDPSGGSWARLAAHGMAGAAACAVALLVLRAFTPGGTAMALFALSAPLIFLVVARRYFQARGAREALGVAGCFAAATVVVELGGTAMGAGDALGFATACLTPLFVFGVTWVTGSLMATLPWPRPTESPAHATVSRG